MKPLHKTILIWLLCATAAVYIRLYPLWGHIWSPTNEQATMAVIYNLKSNFLNQIHVQYPQMPIEEAQRLAAERLNDVLHQQHAKVMDAIEKVSQNMHEQAGLADDPLYLLESDPFYYYYLTQNIVDTGHVAAQVKSNKYFEPLMKAPFGFWQPMTIHPYIGFLVYKTAALFNPHIPLMSAVAYTPIVITLFVLMAFLWCGRLLNLSAPAICGGCFALSMFPLFLKRSALGWYDTDPYNLLFPFIFLGVFFKTIDRKQSPLICGAFLGLMLLLYSLIWQGWIFLFFMTFISAGAVGGFALLARQDKASFQDQVSLSLAYLGTTVVLGSCLYGMGGFLSFFTDGASEFVKFTVKGMNLWPNLFLEVGELEKSSVAQFIGNTGPVLLFGALAGLFYARLSLKAVAIAVFTLVTVVLTFKAERFAVFTLVPLSLLLAFGLEWLFTSLKNLPYAKISKVLVLGVFLVFCWQDGNANVRTVLTPIFNTAWDQALTDVKASTPPDSTINTWWPPGHFIKAIARRRVPFDGASLSESGVGYWMANALLSTDEDKARGIVRMLNLSGNKATEFLTAKGVKTSQAIALLHLITAQTLPEAKETLKPYLNSADLDHLLGLTHGGSPHSYMLVYSELVDENIGLVFTARQNFKKIEEINANPQLLAAVPSPNSHDFIDFLWNLSGGPSKYSEPLSLAGKTDGGLVFDQGLTVRSDMGMATINSSQYGKGIPASIVFKKDGRVIEQELPNATLNYSVLVYEQDGAPICRLMDKALADSLIMRMYFFDGAGLKDFKLTTSTHDLTGRTRIKIFQVLYN